MKPTLVTPTAGQRGMTELHYAAYCNDPDSVRVQLQCGVAVDVRDENGWTPLYWSVDMAQACGEPEQVVSLLLSAGASANAADHHGVTVLMRACGRNNEEILAALLHAGANVHSRSENGITSLHEAAECGFSEAVRRLLALGADPNQRDQWNRTPEDLARECGFEECVALLRLARLEH